MKTNERSYRIDLLKALAIIAVVFYHSGNLINGYLGVEVFFVIAGYFLMNSFLKLSDKNKFNYIDFVIKKLNRF